ncbi:MAG: SurA N-terminal domain-containing protein [Acidobacteriota bacterium]|nr:SurA N-terminal domain-containing protein [Acidobacteriota bacterium]
MKREKRSVKLISLFAFFALAIIPATAQTVVDKTVASVSDGVQSELITYSDLLWQLALQPDTPINEPRKEDLEGALRTLTDQRLIALEAERLPTVTPSEAEVTAEIRRIVEQFPAASVFEARLRRVGFKSIEDPNFRRIVEQRLAIEKYLDFRFRSFIVVTPTDEEQYYREVYLPEFRRRNPNVVPPQLDSIRNTINQQITEMRIETEINRFLEEARNRASITTLYPV